MTLPEQVFIVCSDETGVPLSVYTTYEAAQADVDAVKDGRYVEPWVLKDGYTIGRFRCFVA